MHDRIWNHALTMCKKQWILLWFRLWVLFLSLSFHVYSFAIVQLPSITDSHAESCMQLLHYSCTYIQCIYRRAVGWISKLLSIIIYTICADSDQEVSLTINEVAVICTTVTFILAILSGCVCGALLMYWLMRKKAVYSLTTHCISWPCLWRGVT